MNETRVIAIDYAKREEVTFRLPDDRALMLAWLSTKSPCDVRVAIEVDFVALSPGQICRFVEDVAPELERAKEGVRSLQASGAVPVPWPPARPVPPASSGSGA